MSVASPRAAVTTSRPQLRRSPVLVDLIVDPSSAVVTGLGPPDTACPGPKVPPLVLRCRATGPCRGSAGQLQGERQEVSVVRAVVLYESLFGNTRLIAEAVADGLRAARPDAAVECRGVDETGNLPEHLDLLVLGAPTHFWGLTRTLSRTMEG